MSANADYEKFAEVYAAWSKLLDPAPWIQAPRNLFQDILHGWIFANQVVINDNNSSAPETERAIVARESYGRQLGKILEAVAVLVKDRQGRPDRSKKAEDALDDLTKLHDRVTKIKRENVSDRLERINHDLEALRKADRHAYQYLVDRLNDELQSKHHA